MYIGRFYDLAKKAVSAWFEDYAPSMGAAIAFYTVFSLAPLIIIVITVASVFWGRDAVQGQLFEPLSVLVGAEGVKAVQSVAQSAQAHQQGPYTTIVSGLLLVVGSTTVFAELQRALDRIWDVPVAKRKPGIWNVIRTRLLSLGLVFAIAFLLIVSLLMTSLLGAMGSMSAVLLPDWVVLHYVVNIAVALVFLTVLFALIFRYMPKATVAWHDVWTGAFVTAVLFEVGRYVIALYVGKASAAFSYAAAGSLVIVLIWVYFAALVFLLGAEFTRVYAHEHGSLRQPAD